MTVINLKDKNSKNNVYVLYFIGKKGNIIKKFIPIKK
jgi:hypothetical protein